MFSSKHRLTVLVDHINQWHRSGVPKEQIAIAIVETFRKHGYDEALQCEDIFFILTSDVFADANRNRQKIWRWTGEVNDGLNKCVEKLFYMDEVIVAAMPESIRLSYLNEVYSASNIQISAKSENKGDLGALITATAHSIKETSESHQAALSITPDSPIDVIKKAVTETKEMVSSDNDLLGHLEEILRQKENIPRLSSVRIASGQVADE